MSDAMFEELLPLVDQWAEDKGIFLHSDPKSQLLKTVSEVGELADAINKDNMDEVVDALGDVLVTLQILATMKGVRLEECLDVAYKVISKRDGEMVNGVFVKNEEGEYE